MPDVVLMDVRMPEMNGLDAARAILSASHASPVRVLMLTTFDIDDYVYEALALGASGFLLKDAPAEELIRGVRVVAAGDAATGTVGDGASSRTSRPVAERGGTLLPAWPI